MSMRTVITGGHIVTDSGDVRADLVIDDHEIVAMLATAEGVDADQTIDATDLLLLPGGVDIRFPAPWLNQPDQSALALSTQQSAAAGGVTTFAADSGVPQNETGSQTSVASDVALWYPIDGANLPSAAQVSRMVQTGVAGFSVSLLPGMENDSPISDGQLYDLMRSLGKFGVPLSIQPLHPAIDPREPMAERLGVTTALLFAEETGAWVHFSGISTGQAMRQIVEARGRGARVTASVSALHLALEAGDPTRHIRVMPPFRDREDVEELWSYVMDESVDCVGATSIRRASSRNAASLDAQSALSLFWDEAVVQRKMSHAQAARMLSSNAAQILGIYPRKGSLTIGSDADIVLFDPLGAWTARDHDLLDGSHWSPISGREVTGFVVRTIRRGQTVYDAEQHDEPLLAGGSGLLLNRGTATTQG